MTLDLKTENALIQLVREAAQTEIMPRFRNLPEAAVKTKSSEIDIVTEADLRAEAWITAGIDSILPGALIVGEEAAAADPSCVDGLAEAEVAVIIDPVDGTWNFANGVAAFGVILAVSVRGQTVFGLLYDPVLDDWVLTRRGGGTWFVAKDKAPRALQVAAERSYAEASGFIPHYLFSAEEQVKLAPGLICGAAGQRSVLLVPRVPHDGDGQLRFHPDPKDQSMGSRRRRACGRRGRWLCATGRWARLCAWDLRR